MSRVHLLFLLMAGCVGCAETQSQQAFTPRRAAEVVPPSTAPNRFREHDSALADALDRSLQELEDEPMAPTRSAVDKETSATRDVHDTGDTRASKTAGVAP